MSSALVFETSRKPSRSRRKRRRAGNYNSLSALLLQLVYYILRRIQVNIED